MDGLVFSLQCRTSAPLMTTRCVIPCLLLLPLRLYSLGKHTRLLPPVNVSAGTTCRKRQLRHTELFYLLRGYGPQILQPQSRFFIMLLVPCNTIVARQEHATACPSLPSPFVSLAMLLAWFGFRCVPVTSICSKTQQEPFITNWGPTSLLVVL